MDDLSQDDPTTMPLPELVKRCREERAKFRQKRKNNPAYCLELFHRALAPSSTDGDWQAFVDTYADQLESWFCNHSAFRAALAREEASFYINGAFLRLRNMNQKQPLTFPTLPEALAYLRRCLTNSMLNTIRDIREHSSLEFDINQPGIDPFKPMMKDLARKKFWGMVLECTPGARDRRLLYLRWVKEYKPKYIHQEFPDEFPEPEEKISQMLANMLVKLKRCFKAKGYRWEDLDDLEDLLS